MRKYYAAPGSPFTDDDAEKLGPWLSQLAESGHGDPRDIRDLARDPDSPAHPYFDWNDQTAAEAYRLQQARRMANSIVVKVRTADGSYTDARAFYSVQVTDNREGAHKPWRRVYVTIDQVKESPAMGDQIIEDARARLMAWANRYEKYRALFPSFEEEFGPVFELVESKERMEEGRSVA